MKIAIVDVPVVNIYGGAQMLCEDLCNQFVKYGYNARVFHIVNETRPLRHYLTNSLIASQYNFDFADLVIPMASPAWVIRHDNCIPWIIRQNSSAYEWFSYPEYGGLESFGAEGRLLKDLIRNADINSLKCKKRVYTISPMVTDILQEHCGINAKTLTIPFEPEPGFFCAGYEDYVFYPGRITRSKRPLLAVEAMRYVRSGVKLLLAGSTNDTAYRNEIIDSITKYELDSKIQYIDRFFSAEEKKRWFSRCLGSMYLGFDESYWSLVATEAAFCSKPIIAPIDTGATKYLVMDKETGYTPEPTPESIAEALDRLYNDRKKTIQMGKAIFHHVQTLLPSWEYVVRVLADDGKA